MPLYILGKRKGEYILNHLHDSEKNNKVDQTSKET